MAAEPSKSSTGHAHPMIPEDAGNAKPGGTKNDSPGGTSQKGQSCIAELGLLGSLRSQRQWKQPSALAGHLGPAYAQVTLAQG